MKRAAPAASMPPGMSRWVPVGLSLAMLAGAGMPDARANPAGVDDWWGGRTRSERASPIKSPDTKSLGGKSPDGKSLDGKPAQRRRAAEDGPSALPRIPQGPLHIIVSIARQQVTLFADGAPVAASKISSGTATHPTPMGVFSVLQKRRHHVSNLYDAQMPYMQRITWSGSALHEGPLPGYPASHGCVRLPTAFAQLLWKATRIGARVIITREEARPVAIEHPALFVAKPQEPPAEPARPIEMSRHSGLVTPPRSRPQAALVRTADASLAVAGAVLPDASKPLAAEPQRAYTGEQPTKLPLGGDIDELSMPDDTGSTPAPAAAAEVRASASGGEAPQAEPGAKTEIPAPIVIEERPAVRPSAPAATTTTAAPATPVRKGTVSVFVSLKESRMFVRQGMEPLFDAPVTIARPGEPIGTHVYTAMAAKADGGMRWTVVSIPSRERRRQEPKTADGARKPSRSQPVHAVEPAPTPVLSPAAALDRITMPADAVQRIATLLTPGASLIVSDNKLSGETGATTDFIVETH